MYYPLRVDDSNKLEYLEVLLGQADIIADALSLASPRSREEVTMLARAGRHILADVERPDDLPIFRRDLPLVGLSRTEELDHFIAEFDSIIVPAQEAHLEMDLAMIYTALMQCDDQKISDLRCEKIISAHTKTNTVFGVTIFNQRSSTIRYFDAAAHFLEGGEYNDVARTHIEKTVHILTEEVLPYVPNSYHGFMVYFTLGRLELLRLDKSKAFDGFDRAYTAAEKLGNTKFLDLSSHYLKESSSATQMGTVLEDPVWYKKEMNELATMVSRSQIYYPSLNEIAQALRQTV